MSGTKWTEDQSKAIYTRDCNLLVAAAAGSGKTAVLVERIIKIITNEERPTDVDRLLVVTFTNAAAAEMRERIGNAISKELDANPNSEILQKQLTLLNKASITTLHSFCLSVIKNNFHVIDLDPNFRMADATETILLKQEVLEELIEDKYEQAQQGFLDVVECYSGNRNDNALIALIEEIHTFTMSNPNPIKWLKNSYEELNVSDDFDISTAYFGKVLLKDIELELNSLTAKLENAMTICESIDELEPCIVTLQSDFEKIENLKNTLEVGYRTFYNSVITTSFDRIKAAKKGAPEDKKKIVTTLRDDVKKTIKDYQEKLLQSPEEIIESLRFMYPIIKSLSELVIEFDNRFTKKKREKGVLDFNDLEHLTLKILRTVDENEENIPSEVALLYREKFEEVLVDEYQDSNNVQETIINMVSRRTTDNPNVFMVGDVKQSIYRFRQAKPELFLQKYNTYSKEENSKEQKILLYKNFRSRAEVLSGVNYIFKVLMSKNVGDLDYTDEEKLNPGATFKESLDENVLVGGDIELHIVDVKDDKKEDEENEEVEEINENQDVDSDEEDLDKIQIEARLVANRIKELMNTNCEKVFEVYDKNLDKYRPVKYKDIVILLRASSSFAPVFTEELTNVGIPVFSDSNTGYFDTIEIKTIISLLQIIDNPLQDIPLLAVLRSPIFKLTPQELIDLRLKNKYNHLYENIEKYVNDEKEENEENEVSATILDNVNIHKESLYEKLNDFLQKLKKWRELAVHMPIDEFIWYLYNDTSYYGFVGAMPNGIQRQANLKILFQRAKQFEQSSYKGVFNFINFIHKLKHSSGDMGSAKVIGENEDVVRIMTIHKSKGLEFPIVFLSGCGKQFNLQDLRGKVLYHEDLGYGPQFIDFKRRISNETIKKVAIKKKFKLETISEEMRVLYVALTRAKEKLILTGSVKDIEKTVTRWCTIADMGLDTVPDYGVLKLKSYLDWIGTALAKHSCGKELREISKIDVTVSNFEKDSLWKIKILNKEFCTGGESFVEKLEEKNENVDKNFEESYPQWISDRLDFKYKYDKASNIVANITVSDVKKSILQKSESEDQSSKLYKKPIIKKPVFLTEKKGLTAAELGTVIHFSMKHMDLDKVDSIENIENMLDNMVTKELLLQEERKEIDSSKIFNFFKSEIGTRLLTAHKKGQKIYRETPFYIEIPATELNKDLSTEYETEMVRLQGVIDCYFIEDNKIVLVDYKSDYIKDGKEQELVDKYKIQLDYYTKALTQITGITEVERILYSFYLNDGITI